LNNHASSIDTNLCFDVITWNCFDCVELFISSKQPRWFLSGPSRYIWFQGFG